MKQLTWVTPNPFMEVLHIQTENQHIQLTVQSTHTFTHCPTCATVSSRIHSRYTRRVQDMPFNEKSVLLLILTRKWFCDNTKCATRIFTERLKGIQSHRRRTQRVEEVLRKIAFSTSCLTAEKIAHALHISVSHDALLSLIYQTEFETNVSPFLGVDDFSFRKGHTYGTLICDYQTGIPLALLPDRNPKTLTLWLKQFPHIQMVTRDGFTAFRQAISKANPAIEQVYDRWHFIRNAKKQVTDYIATLLPSTITWSSSHKINTETLAVSFTRSEEEVFARQTQKRRRIQQVKNAYKEGQTIAQLARTFQLDRRTVKKYIHLRTWSSSAEKSNR